MKKYSFIIILPLILTTFTCHNDNWVLLRASSDYFPIHNGNYWKYQYQNTLIVVEVKNDTVINNTLAKIITRNFENEYWLQNDNELKKLELRYVNYGGIDYPIQNVFLLQYKFPFILGSSWSTTFNDTVNVLGENYVIKQTIARQVVAIEDINVPAGSFFQTYKIDFIESFMLNDSTEYYAGSEWYAPDVGLVKRVINHNEQVLIEYSLQ